MSQSRPTRRGSRAGLLLCCVLIALIASLALGGVEAKQLVTSHFTIEYDQISDQTVSVVARDAEQAFRDIRSFLGVKWHDDKIKLIISSQFVEPYMSRPDMTVGIPPNRLSPSGAATGPEPISGRAMPFWNALVHVVAPSAVTPPDWGRFVTEGFGIYMQSRFGGQSPTPWPAKYYPTMGEALHDATASEAAKIGLLALPDAIRLLDDRRLTEARRLAWLQAGSFVQYLIDTGGKDRFVRWYNGVPFETVYGSETIEQEWTKFIRQFKTS